MTRFQRHIGKLTADVEMELVNRHAAAIGDKVRISGGGLLEGQEGIVKGNTECGRKLRLRAQTVGILLYTVEWRQGRRNLRGVCILIPHPP